jgi:methionyl-tRNA synthetase
MAHKYFKGVVPEIDPTVEAELQLDVETQALHSIDGYVKFMESFEFHKAMSCVWEFINHLNKFIDLTAPWELAKKKTSWKQLQVVIYHLLEGLRIISGLIYPVMPGTAAIMQRHLGLDSEKPFYRLDSLQNFKTIVSKTKLPKSVALFPRIDVKQDNGGVSEPDARFLPEPGIKPEISIEEFGKLDLRVGTVTRAEVIPRAKKLLKLEVDLGEKRTIVAGIAESYSPEMLVGKQIIIIANLKPVKIMGVLSKGMMLAAVDHKRLTIATLDNAVTPGTALS